MSNCSLAKKNKKKCKKEMFFKHDRLLKRNTFRHVRSQAAVIIFLWYVKKVNLYIHTATWLRSKKNLWANSNIQKVYIDEKNYINKFSVVIKSILLSCLVIKPGNPRSKFSVMRCSWVGRVIIRPITRRKPIRQLSITIDTKWQPIFTPIHSPLPFPWVS